MSHPPKRWTDELDLDGWDGADLRLQLAVPTRRMDLQGCRAPDGLILELAVTRAGLPGAYEYRFRGEVTGKLELGCVRCLGEFERTLRAAFDLRFLPISIMPPRGRPAGGARSSG